MSTPAISQSLLYVDLVISRPPNPSPQLQDLKGNSRQILLSEMSLPGIEVLIEKLLPKILGRLGKENFSKRHCKVAFVRRKCAVTLSVSVQFYMLRTCTTSQAKISVCMQGSRECCTHNMCTHSRPICPSFYRRPPSVV